MSSSSRGFYRHDEPRQSRKLQPEVHLRVNATSPRAFGYQHNMKQRRKWKNSISDFSTLVGEYFVKDNQRQWPHIATASLAAVFVLLLCYSFLLPMKINGFLPVPTGYPWGNLRRTWIRIRFGYQLEHAARKAASMPRYIPSPPGQEIDIFVVSLKSNRERRASVKQQFEDRNIKFQWWDAVDGANLLPEDEVMWYLSGKRRRDFLKSQPGSYIYRKAACDLSHLRIMHDMIANGREIQMVVEDDMQIIPEDFLNTVDATLRALPEDWEVLWLNHGGPVQRKPSNLIGWVGKGVRMFLDNSSTVGMIYRKSFALKVLNDAQIGNKNIDNLMNDMGQLGRIKAYVADPPLIKTHEKGFASQIDVEKKNKT